MIARPQRGKSRLGLSRRNLLIGIIVIAVIFLAVRVTHGKSSKKAVQGKATGPVAACVVAPGGAPARGCSAGPIAAKHLPRRHGKPGKQPPMRHFAPPALRLTAVQLYARHLLPALVHSTPQFAAAGLAVQNTSIDSLSGTCSSYAGKIKLLTDEVDGVPHPGNWYSPVSSLHFKVLGVYHDMSGALLACATAADNADDSAIATARQDLATAIDRLHEIRSYTWWVGYRHI